MKEPTTCKEVLLVEAIAKACHEANRAYCISMGDASQKPWDEAADWQRESARRGVRFALDNPTTEPSAQHESWLKDKQADGWIYGPVKDADKKTHPCCVPWDELPFEQRIKDFLFKATIKAFLAGADRQEELDELKNELAETRDLRESDRKHIRKLVNALQQARIERRLAEINAEGAKLQRDLENLKETERLDLEKKAEAIFAKYSKGSPATDS